MRLPLSMLSLLAFTTLAQAGPDDAEWEIGSTFSSPSKNIFCAYYDAGGETGSAFHDQKSEIHCLRVEPSPLLVTLSGKGVLKVNPHPSKDDIETQRVTDNGRVLAYGETDKSGIHLCLSTEKGMKCTVDGKGFILSKAGVEKLK